MPRIRMTMEFEVPDETPGYGSLETAISLTIVDALSEFRQARSRSYVETRYPWLKDERLAEKIASVAFRNRLSEKMQEATRDLKIEKLDRDRGLELDDPRLS